MAPPWVKLPIYYSQYIVGGRYLNFATETGLPYYEYYEYYEYGCAIYKVAIAKLVQTHKYTQGYSSFNLGM